MRPCQHDFKKVWAGWLCSLQIICGPDHSRSSSSKSGMRAFLRSRVAGDNKQSGGPIEIGDQHDGEEKPVAEKAKPSDSPLYMTAITLLSCLLLSTLYLLRHDNKQLGVAERKIRDLRRHVGQDIQATPCSISDFCLIGCHA